MRGGPLTGLTRLVAAWLAIGLLWCVLTNVHAGLVGAPSVFTVITGTAGPTVKAETVVRLAGRQILLWPVDLYEKVLRHVVG